MERKYFLGKQIKTQVKEERDYVWRSWEHGIENNNGVGLGRVVPLPVLSNLFKTVLIPFLLKKLNKAVLILLYNFFYENFQNF